MPLFFPSRVLRAATQNLSGFKWSETLALPRSTFPARPSPAQLEQYRQRCADDLYTWQSSHRPSKVRNADGEEASNEFILHDGPPYANGAVHIGHALNKVLKDLIVRWNLAKGKRVDYRPGWDCHGLPIELKALQAPRSPDEQATSLEDAPKEETAAAPGAGMSAPDIRSVARRLASETIEKQMASFREWGIMGDWDKPYKTMDPAFEISQLEVFKRMMQKGLISRKHRPVYWSPSSRTALAEAELEYDDNHKCTAAFVKMPFVQLPQALQDNEHLKSRDVSALIWTTTPWTLPANQAVAVHENIQYAVVAIEVQTTSGAKSEQSYVVVAQNRLDHLMSHLPNGTQCSMIKESIKGSQLADGAAACLNIFTGSESPIIAASYVTETSGTGLVHTAPGHGMDDYQLCESNNIGPAIAPVDDAGCYTDEAFPVGGQSDMLKGLNVQSDGVEAVLYVLRDRRKYLPGHGRIGQQDLVLATHEFSHKNPIDWRTKQPVIVRATAQWFADVSAIKCDALRALEDVTFIPEAGNIRLRSFVEGRSQWCISRQRAWGVPIPVLYHQETGEACISEESISHIIDTVKLKGADAWFSDAPNDHAWIHPSLWGEPWIRGTDTMDVWFDSGTTWTTLKPRDGQAVSDVYLEGTDQHRGWFQSSLLTHVATRQSNTGNAAAKAPFGTLITHGFTLDAEGKKMSKSLGNVISPDQILDGSLLPPLKLKKQKGANKHSLASKNGPQYDAMGPDVLRLWVASSDYTRDVSVSVPVLQSVQQALQKLRVTFKFLLGVLKDYTPSSDSENQENLGYADIAVLHQLSKTSQSVWTACEEYKFYKAINDINAFVNADLSPFYFEIVKDAAYAGSKAVRTRTQGVLVTILDEMMKMLAPVTPHLIEEVWEHFPTGMKNENNHPLKRVSSGPYQNPQNQLTAEEIDRKLKNFHAVSTAVKSAQEEARNAGRLGSGLACDVVILPPKESSGPVEHDFAADLATWSRNGELADLLVVSNATVVKTLDEYDAATNVDWKHEANMNGFEETTDGYDRVAVIPPKQHKCVRCWKYTAETTEEPCGRCRDVLKEMKDV